MKTVVIVGALDTKGPEFAFVKDIIEKQGLHTLIVDFGILGEPTIEPDIRRDEVAEAAGGNLETLRRDKHRGEAIGTMAAGLAVVARPTDRGAQGDGLHHSRWEYTEIRWAEGYRHYSLCG